MANLYNYYSLTTGINIDPKCGSLAKSYYNQIKNVLGLSAEIEYESDIRRVKNQNIASVLSRYTGWGNITVFQWLFGLNKYSDGWKGNDLVTALSDITIQNPQLGSVGDLCLDYYTMLLNNFDFYSSDGSNWTRNYQSIDFSNYTGTINDGYSSSIWFVVSYGIITPYIKDGFTWMKLSDWALANNKTIYFGANQPSAASYNYWINLSHISLKQYQGNQTWSAEQTISYNISAPVSPSNGDYWATMENNNIVLYQRVNSTWVRKNFADNFVYEIGNNSKLTAITTNNFVLYYDDDALKGVPFFGDYSVGNISFYGQGSLVGAFPEVNFTGAGVSTTQASATRVDVTITPVYDIGATYSSTMTSGFVVIRFPVPHKIQFSTSMSGSYATVATAPTSSAVFSLKKNGTEFATMTFGASQTSATFSAASPTTFNPGDVLTVVAPTPADSTLAGLGFGLSANRIP